MLDQHLQLDALGDPTRRAILRRLRSGPAPVGELAQNLPVSRPAVSQHLKILKEARLVKDIARGRNRYYQLDLRGFATVRAYFDSFWNEALENFKAKVEE